MDKLFEHIKKLLDEGNYDLSLGACICFSFPDGAVVVMVEEDGMFIQVFVGDVGESDIHLFDLIEGELEGLEDGEQ